LAFFRLAPAAKIRWMLAGRTLDVWGRPLPRATVTLFDTLQGTRRALRSGPRGTFQFKGLMSGLVYEVSAKFGDAVSPPERVRQLAAEEVVLIDLKIPASFGFGATAKCLPPMESIVEPR
jgi:hypothetical protein